MGKTQRKFITGTDGRVSLRSFSPDEAPSAKFLSMRAFPLACAILATVFFAARSDGAEKITVTAAHPDSAARPAETMTVLGVRS